MIARTRRPVDVSRATILEARHGTKERNDRIAERSLAGELHVDLAREYGVTKARIGHIVRNRGVPGRVPAKGAAHPLWGGGKSLSSGGYIRIFMPEHHLANAKGWVLEHVYVAELHFGREIQPNEIVHHKNEIRNDNRPENLEIMDRAAHSSYHRRLALSRNAGGLRR